MKPDLVVQSQFAILLRFGQAAPRNLCHAAPNNSLANFITL